MYTNGDVADLGKVKQTAFQVDGASPGGVGERTIPADPFETRETGFLQSNLDSTKEVLVGALQAFETVLHDL